MTALSFAPDEHAQAVAELASRICRDFSSPEAFDRADAGSGVQADALRALGRASLLGLCREPNQLASLCSAIELCTAAGDAMLRVPVAALSAIVAPALHTAEHPALADVLEGRTVACAALAEAYDALPTSPACRADESGTSLLSGEKVMIEAGHAAQLFVVSAADDKGASLFIVHRDDIADLQEQRATSLERVVGLQLRRTPATRVGATHGEAHRIHDLCVDRYRLLLSAHQLGVARRALAMTAEHVNARQQFGVSLASFQAVKQRFADAWIGCSQLDLAVREAAWRLDNGRSAGRAIAVATHTACVAGQAVTYAAQHLHGGTGVDRSYPLHRYFLRSRMNAVLLGGAARSLEAIANSLAEEAHYGSSDE